MPDVVPYFRTPVVAVTPAPYPATPQPTLVEAEVVDWPHEFMRFEKPYTQVWPVSTVTVRRFHLSYVDFVLADLTIVRNYFKDHNGMQDTFLFAHLDTGTNYRVRFVRPLAFSHVPGRDRYTLDVHLEEVPLA